MNDKEMRTLETELKEASDALTKAQHYFDAKNAYECENWSYQCNVHLRKVLQRTTEWADTVEQTERINREKRNESLPTETCGTTNCKNCTWAETMCDKDKLYCRAPDNDGQHHFVCRENWALQCDRFNPKGGEI